MDQIIVTTSSPSVLAGEELYASASFLDGGSPVTPDSTDYKIDLAGASFLANGTIRDWTPAVPGESTSVLLEGPDTEVLPSDYPLTGMTRQRMQVVFRATLGEDTVFAAGLYDILVLNDSGQVTRSRPRTRYVVLDDGRIFETPRTTMELEYLLQMMQPQPQPAPPTRIEPVDVPFSVIPIVQQEPQIVTLSANTGLRRLARKL